MISLQIFKIFVFIQNFSSHLTSRFYIQTLLVQDLDFIFKRDYNWNMTNLVDKIRDFSNVSNFANQISKWGLHQQPTFYQIPTQRGFGFCFNLVKSSEMFHKRLDISLRNIKKLFSLISSESQKISCMTSIKC